MSIKFWLVPRLGTALAIPPAVGATNYLPIRAAIATREAQFALVSGFAAALMLLVPAGLAIWRERKRRMAVEADLRRSEARCRLLFEDNPQAAWIYDAKTYAFLRVNSAELIRARTAELEAANKELEAFSYSVSHDLRAPLRAIDGFGQALLEENSGQLDDEGKRRLERIRRAAQRMGLLIDDLLKLARLTRAELRRQRVDLTAIAREVAEGLRKGDGGRTVEFRIADGLSAHGDPHLMRVVLENLIGNAWKFTAKRSPGIIEFRDAGRTGGATFLVRDNGAGFDPAYASHLFTPFERLHSEAEFAGSGIGLATVQRIVTRHGGKVWAEGAVERGATFYFEVPQ